MNLETAFQSPRVECGAACPVQRSDAPSFSHADEIYDELRAGDCRRRGCKSPWY